VTTDLKRPQISLKHASYRAIANKLKLYVEKNNKQAQQERESNLLRMENRVPAVSYFILNRDLVAWRLM
jgi:hypothetical protein